MLLEIFTCHCSILRCAEQKINYSFTPCVRSPREVTRDYDEPCWPPPPPPHLPEAVTYMQFQFDATQVCERVHLK